MPIDFHCHAFSAKIAEKAVSFLVDYYGIPALGRGELKDALQAEERAGCRQFVLLIAATKPAQVLPANNWAITIKNLIGAELAAISGLADPPRPVVFGSLHPDYPDMLSELERLKRAGIKGVKIHPEFQGFSLDDPKMDLLYEALEDDFIVLTHVGDRENSGNNLSTPQKIRKVIAKFPRLRIVAAHLGGYRLWKEALEELAGKNVHFDLSSTLKYIDPSLLKEIVKTHDPGRLLYGSDYPLGDPGEELRLLEETGLFSPDLLEAVTERNARELLKSVGMM